MLSLIVDLSPLPPPLCNPCSFCQRVCVWISVPRSDCPSFSVPHSPELLVKYGCSLDSSHSSHLSLLHSIRPYPPFRPWPCLNNQSTCLSTHPTSSLLHPSVNPIIFCRFLLSKYMIYILYIPRYLCDISRKLYS